MTSVTVRTPAKINLVLGVGAPRDDGYHPLATVYQAVDLFDHLSVSPAADEEVTVEVCSGDPVDAAAEAAPGDEVVADVPTDDTNLAVRAARLLARSTGTTAGARMRLRKSIPVAGGLAGGSSDAAAALVACNRLWGTGLSPEDLQELGMELGSDVPFCLLGGTAVGSGRGELVTPALTRGRYHWVLAVSAEGLSTPAVYDETDRLRSGTPVVEPVVPQALMCALRDGDPTALGRALSNDLQSAALSLRPELAELLDIGRSCGALGAVVSGSGPTCAFLANDEAHAMDIGVGLASAGPFSAVHRVVGPASGAAEVDG